MLVFVTGATGLIARRLIAQLLKRGDTVYPLSRKPIPTDAFGPGDCRPIQGDPAESGPWLEQLKFCDAVVHLAGEPILGSRWNENILKRLRDSRVQSTNLLAKALTAKTTVFLSGSAVGYYGADTGDAIPVEGSAPGSDILARICVVWEAAAVGTACRVVHPRTGIVLDPAGGAFPKMARPFRLFAGGPLGSGKQFVPWIHHEDMTALLLYLLDNPECVGAFNACAPNPVTNAEFGRILGKVMHRPSWLPVPKLALRILLGQAAEVVVGGQRALPEKALASGFRFRFEKLEDAVRNLLQPGVPAGAAG